MLRYVAIVNPASGGGRKHARKCLDHLTKRGFIEEMRETRGPGDATRLARSAAEDGAKGVLVCGGDGTIFESVNGLFATTKRPKLAFLPLGTGNSFLRDFACQSADAMVRRIEAERTQSCDVLRITHREGVLYSLNLVGVGFSAQVADVREASFSHLGTPGYILAVVQTLAQLRPLKLKTIVDGQEQVRDYALISFCNSQYTGGAMRMAPRAKCDDGLLDIVAVEHMSRLELLKTFPRIYSGTHIEHAKVKTWHARRVEFPEEPTLRTMIDGELRTLTLRSIEVLPSAVELVV